MLVFSPDSLESLTTPVLDVFPLIEEFLPPVEWELIGVIHGDNALLVVVIMKFVTMLFFYMHHI